MHYEIHYTALDQTAGPMTYQLLQVTRPGGDTAGKPVRFKNLLKAYARLGECLTTLLADRAVVAVAIVRIT